MPSLLACSTSFLLTVLLVCCPHVAAWQLFSSSAAADFGETCASVLTQNITACDNLAEVFDPSAYYQESDLTSSCNATCGSALATWYQDAESACSNVTFVNDYGDYASVSSLVGQISFNFNQTCLQSNGLYCNVVLGDIANATTNSTNSTVAPCDSCIMSMLLNQAESPFSNGPLVYSESLYQSYTSSCGYTGPSLTGTFATQTLAPSTVSGLVPASTSGSQTTAAAATCSSTYQAPSDASCDSVAVAAGTATWWLLLDNDLPAYCVNFTTLASGEALCIDHPCTTYTVQTGDNCTSIAAAYNVTTIQLETWNPWIDSTCYNINSTIGTAICVEQPGTQYVPPSSAIGSPTVAVSAVPVPTDIAANTTEDCGEYYLVQPGDYCDLVILKFGLSLTDFLILNPAINTNCTNLYANESYCVEPVGSINDYPGAPFYGLNNTNYTGPAFTSYPASNYTPAIPLQPLTLAPNTSANCSILLAGTSLIFNYTSASDCYATAVTFGLTLAQLQQLNPSLNTSSPNCTFEPYDQYCIVQSNATVSIPPLPSSTYAISTASAASSAGTITATSSTASTTGSATLSAATSTSTSTSSTASSTTSTSAIPSPTQSNSISQNCNAYAEAVSGDYCSQFAAANDITTSQLYNWNQALGVNGSSCSTDFWANEYYCVGVDIPSPTQSGSIPANCDVYAETISGDGCYSFAERNNITTSELYEWNTVLGTNGANCGTDLYLSYYYCTGVNGELSS